MSETNLGIVRKMWDADNAHDVAGFKPFLDPTDYFWQDDAMPTPVRSPQEAGEKMQMYWKAFPDSHYVVEEMLASGDYVISRVRATGTHQGELMGIPATNRKIDLQLCVVHKFRGGKVRRTWTYWDTGTLLRQIGALPQLGKPQKA